MGDPGGFERQMNPRGPATMKPPPNGLCKVIKDLFQVKGPEQGSYVATVKRADYVESIKTKASLLILHWRPTVNPLAWRAVDLFPWGPSEEVRNRGRNRLISLLMYCGCPNFRPKQPQDLVGLRCLIRVRTFQHWQSPKLISVVQDYRLSLGLDLDSEVD